MQQVPVVEIDGITLSQSVSPLILVFLNLNFCEILEYLCKIHAYTVGSDPVHRRNASGASSSSSWPKETRSGSDDQWPHCIRNSASAGKHWASQMIVQLRSQESALFPPPRFRICTWFRRWEQKKCSGLSISSIAAFKVGRFFSPSIIAVDLWHFLTFLLQLWSQF